MSTRYFQPRKPFRFAVHPYELGTIIGLRKGYEDNHFLLKLYSIDPARFKYYYAFHLDYFLQRNPNHQQKHFFAHVWSIVGSRIRYFEMQNPFSRRHARYVSNLATLRAFQEFLITYDQWNMRPSDALVLHKDALISSLQQKLEKYEKRVAELEKYEVSLKVMIQQDHLGTVVDLLHQIKALEIPGTQRKLLKSDHDSPYYKLLARYFSHAGKDISIDTARNYFVKKPASDAVKGSKVPSDKKLFRIINRNPSSKT